MEYSIKRKLQILESYSSSISTTLDNHAIKKKIDYMECQKLSQALSTTLQRWKRTTVITLEAIQSLQVQLNKENELILQAKQQLHDADDMLRAAFQENCYIHKVVEKLERKLKYSSIFKNTKTPSPIGNKI